MGKASAEFRHFVHLVNPAPLEEVESVEVFVIVGEQHLVVNLLNAQYGLEDGTLAFLNPLPH